MQHGPLTPLGTQLRSVLLSIRSKPAFDKTTATHQVRFPPSNASSRFQRAQHGPRCYGNAATLSVDALPIWPEEAQKLRENSIVDEVHLGSNTSPEKRRARRQGRYDHITEALKDTPYQHALPAKGSAKKQDLSNVNIRRRGALAKTTTRDSQPSPETAERLGLIPLLAKYIRCAIELKDAPHHTPASLSQHEENYLESRGYSIEDIRAWAEIITALHSHEAAARLLSLLRSRSRRRPPLSLLLYLLRRPRLSASALRQLLYATRHFVEQHASTRQVPQLPENAVMILFVRLVRHAREVWPPALEEIAVLFVSALQTIRIKSRRPLLDRSSRLAHLCNTAMHLLSLPTGAQPFRDAAEQERAIVRVLSFMSKHEPPLLIDRQGYRAVVRVQIAQSKTPSEQQWAELKALSWPPWKQDRNAMDAGITADEHGTSKAAHTLRRMREAGYTPDNWAQAAQLYSGWDMDGSPTIQTRALMGSGMQQYRTEDPIWAARIATTRTAQEAWAAYLAYEETGLGLNSQVIFAIIQKLSKEEERKRAQVSPAMTKRDTRRRARLFSGDRREVDPLPPSVHLYTYTRTPVPTVDAFLQQLHDRGVDLGSHTLALVIDNATSLQHGIWYLRLGRGGEAHTGALLLQEPIHQPKVIPPPLLSAFIERLCRYPSIHMSKVLTSKSEVSVVSAIQPPLLEGHEMNLLHPIVHAFELLTRVRPASPAPWSSILSAMSRKVTLTSMRFFFRDHQCRPSGDDPGGMYTRAKCTMVALSFVNLLLTEMRKTEVEIDERHLQYICLAVENTAVACWYLVKYQARHLLKQQPPLGTFKAETIRDAEQAIDCTLNTAEHMEELFGALVGNVDQHATAESATSSGELELTKLLHRPSPAFLHAYIRALGWLGDHNGLLELTRWMVAHQHELREQRNRDRNGEDLMKLSVLALRVFLERKWLPERSTNAAKVSVVQGADTATQSAESALQRLESPALAEILEEVERLVDSVGDWPSWPGDQEMKVYCQYERFRDLEKLYIE